MVRTRSFLAFEKLSSSRTLIVLSWNVLVFWHFRIILARPWMVYCFTSVKIWKHKFDQINFPTTFSDRLRFAVEVKLEFQWIGLIRQEEMMLSKFRTLTKYSSANLEISSELLTVSETNVRRMIRKCFTDSLDQNLASFLSYIQKLCFSYITESEYRLHRVINNSRF